MRHIRIDNQEFNSRREFACGIDPDLPAGDSNLKLDCIDCQGCKPAEQQLGTPISQLSGRPGTDGFDKFCEIAATWGYD